MPTNMTPEQVATHVRNLQTIGDQLEATNDPRWLPIAQTAATLEALRLGLTAIQPPVWIGIDRANGPDRTVKLEHFHA